MSPGVTINLAQDAVLVPEGGYPVEVDQILARRATAGNIYLSWTLTIIGGGEWDGHTLWMVTSLRSDMARQLRAAFAAFGVEVTGEVQIEWEDDRDLDKAGSPVIKPDLVARNAYAYVVHDEWEGETRAKVKRVIDPT